MSLLVDQWVPEGTCSQVLRSTSVDSWRLRASKFSVLKLIEIVILWVYYTIPFGLSLFWYVWDISFQLLKIHLWLRITDEGSVPEMRIWSILLIKSDLKWCIHLNRSLFLYSLAGILRLTCYTCSQYLKFASIIHTTDIQIYNPDNAKLIFPLFSSLAVKTQDV